MNPEADLSAPVSLWLRSRGLVVYAEVPTQVGCIDLVGVSHSEIVAVELKTTLSQTVRWQAMRCREFAHFAYAATPTSPRDLSLEWAREKGVGVLRVDDAVTEIVPAVRQMPDKASEAKVRARVAHMAEGGTGGMFCHAPRKTCFALVLEYRQKHPKATWKEIYRNVPNHYASASSMRAVMKAWAEIVERNARREREATEIGADF